jgi:hypothetical protein
LLGAGTDEAHIYDLTSNTWYKRKNGPSARYAAFTAWDGGLFLVWGGSSGPKSDGEMYAPSADTWTKLSAGGGRGWGGAERQAGWAARIKPSVTLLLGGVGTNSSALTDGALYNSTSKTWTAVPTWPSGVSHQWGVGVWTGSEFVLWSGLSGTGSTLTATGERYLP